MRKPTSSTAAFEAAATRSGSARYVLRLYVAGSTPRSTLAVETLKAICDEQLAGRYELEVIDVYQQPALAREAQILAVPTLVRHLPAPVRRILGDLSDRQRVLVGLELEQQSEEAKRGIKKKA